jgi:flagellar biosynthesis regulator FlbT
MDLDTLIEDRNQNKKIIQKLKSILETYEKIELFNSCERIQEFINSRKIYQEMLDHYIIYLDEINNKIECSCCHRFIKDVIDIGPESTMNITYCEICEYTKP